MKKALQKISIVSIGFLTPMFVFANDSIIKMSEMTVTADRIQSSGGQQTFQQIVSNLIVTASNYILTLLVGLTVFVFLFGLMKYMFKGQGSDTARSEGRKLMLWGIIGLFVMTSVWGLVAILSNFIGHTETGIPRFRAK